MAIQIINQVLWSLVCVSDEGCSSEPSNFQEVIFDSSPITPIATSSGVLCGGDNGQLFVGGSYPPNATYTWYDGLPGATGTNIISTEANPIISGLNNQNAPFEYWVQVSVNGCTSTADSTSLQLNDIPSSSPTAILGSCGEILSLFANPDPIDTGNDYIYSWTGPNGFSSDEANPTISNLTNDNLGDYQLVIENNNGCSSILNIATLNSLNQLSTPSIDLPLSAVLCEGEFFELSAQVFTGQVVSYIWILNGDTISTGNTPSLIIDSILIANSGEYQLIVNVDGCSTDLSSSVSIVVNPSPMIPTISANTELCVGEDIQLATDFISGATYSWTGPNGFTSALQNPLISPTTLDNARRISIRNNTQWMFFSSINRNDHY